MWIFFPLTHPVLSTRIHISQADMVFQSRKYGFLFADDRESEVFSSEVITRVKAATIASCTSSKVPIDKGMRFTSRYHNSHAIKGPVT